MEDKSEELNRKHPEKEGWKYEREIKRHKEQIEKKTYKVCVLISKPAEKIRNKRPSTKELD